jgi:hypothetical protein
MAQLDSLLCDILENRGLERRIRELVNKQDG